MARLSQHGDFPSELIESAKAQLAGELDFAEEQEPSKRSGAGYPSLGNVLGHGFDFGEEPVSNFYTSDLRRLRDALKIAENNVGKGYAYGSHERVAELRAQLRDLLGQHMRNVAAAQAAAGDPVGEPDDCCTGTPGHGPTGVRVYTDNRGALIPEYREEEPEWSQEIYDNMMKAAEIVAKTQALYASYEHEIRMARYSAADKIFADIAKGSAEFRGVFPTKDTKWDADLKALETKIHDAKTYLDRLPLQTAYMKLQSRYYKDFKGMPCLDPAKQVGIMPPETTLGKVTNFNEVAQETLDFARCQRADGSYYGTSGTCRKGRDAGGKGIDEKKLKAAAAANQARDKKQGVKIAQTPPRDPIAAKKEIAEKGKNNPKIQKLTAKFQALNEKLNREMKGVSLIAQKGGDWQAQQERAEKVRVARDRAAKQLRDAKAEIKL